MTTKGDWYRPVPKDYGERYDKIKKNIDWDYRNHVKELPCLVGQECYGDIDPHHVRSRGAGGKDKSNIIPLCRKHHTEVHQIGVMTFADKYKLGDLRMRAEQLWSVYEGD